MAQPPTPLDAAFANATEPLKVSMTTTLAGEDVVNDRVKTYEAYYYAISISTGTIKASSGVLCGLIGTTTGGMTFKDGANTLWNVSVTAGVSAYLPYPIICTTSITVSASAAVATIIYL
jgi:hypothetical protein